MLLFTAYSLRATIRLQGHKRFAKRHFCAFVSAGLFHEPHKFSRIFLPMAQLSEHPTALLPAQCYCLLVTDKCRFS